LPTPAVRIVPAADAASLARCYAIRRQVFVDEQGVDPQIELDDDDARALHVLALAGEEAVGCARAVFNHERVKIGRMAVRAPLRGRGIGRALLTFLLAAARGRGARLAYLHAQLAAEGFYTRCGFTPVGGVFDEAGIPHRRMELRLEQT
jgi:predicted GNAT family N-acyltransferase